MNNQNDMKEQYKSFKEDVRKYLKAKDDIDDLNEDIKNLILRKDTLETSLVFKRKNLDNKERKFKLYLTCSIVLLLCVILDVIGGSSLLIIFHGLFLVLFGCVSFNISEDVVTLKWEIKEITQEITKNDSNLESLQKELAHSLEEYPDIEKCIKDIQVKLNNIVASMSTKTSEDINDDKMLDEQLLRVRKVNV